MTAPLAGALLLYVEIARAVPHSCDIGNLWEVTGSTLFKVQADELQKQLGVCLGGLSSSDLDFRPHPSALTLRDHLVHLADVYCAVPFALNGERYAWGCHPAAGDSFEALVEEVWARRTTAVSKVLESEQYQIGADYVLLHDAYHVGQLALLRHALDADWSSEALYR